MLSFVLPSQTSVLWVCLGQSQVLLPAFTVCAVSTVIGLYAVFCEMWWINICATKL